MLGLAVTGPMLQRLAEHGRRFRDSAAIREIVMVRLLCKILAHAAALVGIFLAFTTALFLGLQVDPLYGNIGVAVTVVLAVLYVYIGFFKR